MLISDEVSTALPLAENRQQGLALQVARMRRKGAADVDSLRTVDVVASFQLDCLVVVSPAPCTGPEPAAPAATAHRCRAEHVCPQNIASPA